MFIAEVSFIPLFIFDNVYTYKSQKKFYQKQNKTNYLKNGTLTDGGIVDTSQYYNQLIYVPRQATISSITTDTTGFR